MTNASSTVRVAATTACAATCPPKTRWRAVSAWQPAEEVDVEVLELEQRDQLLGRAGHQRSCPSSSRRVEPGEELLELPPDLLTGRHRLVGGQQRRCRTASASRKASYCCSRPCTTSPTSSCDAR